MGLYKCYYYYYYYWLLNLQFRRLCKVMPISDIFCLLLFVLQICAYLGCYLRDKPIHNFVYANHVELAATWLINYAAQLWWVLTQWQLTLNTVNLSGMAEAWQTEPNLHDYEWHNYNLTLQQKSPICFHGYNWLIKHNTITCNVRVICDDYVNKITCKLPLLQRVLHSQRIPLTHHLFN